MKKILLIISFGLVYVFANTIDVTVSILPQKYFVEQIAQDKAIVNVMVKPGFSPATYEPQSSQMKLLTKSKAYFSIGVPFEGAWLHKFESTNKNMLMVDTSRGVKKQEIEEHDHHEETHNEENHHEESGDPHIWLDPMLVKIQAKNIYETLIKLDAKNKDFYKKNYDVFLNDLDNLDIKLANILKPIQKSSFMVFHPSWGYFASRYDLRQIVVEKEGKTPKLREMINLIQESKKYGIKVIFVSPQFSQKAATTIAKSINGKVLLIDHLSYSYSSNLLKIAKDIRNSYK